MRLRISRAKTNKLSVTMRITGDPEAVIGAIANGLPREALIDFKDALDREMRKRAKKKRSTKSVK